MRLLLILAFLLNGCAVANWCEDNPRTCITAAAALTVSAVVIGTQHHTRIVKAPATTNTSSPCANVNLCNM